jgi:hypothetical protein
MKKYNKLCWIIFLTVPIFIGFKVYTWSPFYSFVQLSRWQSAIKLVATVLVSSPFELPDGSPAIKRVGDSVYIVESPVSKPIQDLLKTYPLPKQITHAKTAWRDKVNYLRKHVHTLLPLKSKLPQSPEPVKAVELMGENIYKEKYPKLCSKNSKIFVQYLTALNIDSRMLQLQGHNAVEIWNPSTKSWEVQDPYFDSDVRDSQDNYLSAKDAFMSLKNKTPFRFKGSHEVFKVVGYIPRVNFAGDNLPKWHYFNYDHLDYWKMAVLK